MKSPYGGALRLRRREMDDLRLAIGSNDQKHAAVDAQEQALRAQSQLERAQALQDFHFSHDAYTARIRNARIAIEAERRMVEAERSRLTDQIVEAYGSLRAIEKADEQHRARVEWHQNNAEQARIDDLSAINVIKTRDGARARAEPRPVENGKRPYAGR